MLYSGLVSVTFRAMSPTEIVAFCVEARLRGIEWGADVHLPPGEIALARETGARTLDAGLEVAAYGSYYRAGEPESEAHRGFEAVLDTAVALGAPLIRVWAGRLGSDLATAADRARVAADLNRIAGLAQAAGIGVVLEHHGKTLTDTRDSCARLMQEASHANLAYYWQPLPEGREAEERLEVLWPCLSHLHVFWWGRDAAGQIVRQTLADGQAFWSHWLPRIAALPGDRYALLEFVIANDPAQGLADAATLNTWLSGLSPSLLPSLPSVQPPHSPLRR